MSLTKGVFDVFVLALPNLNCLLSLVSYWLTIGSKFWAKPPPRNAKGLLLLKLAFFFVLTAVYYTRLAHDANNEGYVHTGENSCI